MSEHRPQAGAGTPEAGSLAEGFMGAVRESVAASVYEPPVLHPAQYARALQVLGLPADHRLTLAEYAEAVSRDSQKTFSNETLHPAKDA